MADSYDEIGNEMEEERKKQALSAMRRDQVHKKQKFTDRFEKYRPDLDSVPMTIEEIAEQEGVKPLTIAMNLLENERFGEKLPEVRDWISEHKREERSGEAAPKHTGEIRAVGQWVIEEAKTSELQKKEVPKITPGYQEKIKAISIFTGKSQEEIVDKILKDYFDAG